MSAFTPATPKSEVQPEDRRRRLERLVITRALPAIVIAAFLLRLWKLTHEPMHADEILQAQEVQRPWSELTGASFRIQQTPLDFYIGKLAVSIGGASDFSQRMPAVVFGTALVGLVGWTLMRRGYRAAGLIAAVLLAVHPFLVHYSQYVRPYSLPAAMIAATLAAHHHFGSHGSSRRVQLFFFLLCGLTLFSHALMPVVALALLFSVCFLRVMRHPGSLSTKLAADPLGLVIVPLAVVLVWIPSFLVLRHYSVHLSLDDYDLVSRLRATLTRLRVYGQPALSPYPLVGCLVACLMLVISPRVRSALASTATVWVPLVGTGPAFALVHSLTTRSSQFFADRYLLFLPIGVVTVLAIEVGGLLHSRLGKTHRSLFDALVGVACIVAIGVAGTVSFSRTWKESSSQRTADWGSVGAYLQQNAGNDDAVLAIDCRPFAVAFRWGLMSSPRYFRGAAAKLTPESVIDQDRTSLISADRVHAVLFIPRLANGALPPTGWTVTKYVGMTVVSSPPSQALATRLRDLQALAMWLRPDVAVKTQIAVALVAQPYDATMAAQLRTAALNQAEKLGNLAYAEELLDAKSPTT